MDLPARALKLNKFIDVTFEDLKTLVDRQGRVVIPVITKPKAKLLRLNISCKSHIPEACTMALIADQMMLDCIDHHGRYEDRHGVIQFGWHHHVWHPKTQTAKPYRESLDGFS